MKAVYGKTDYERFIDILEDAKKTNRTINYIELSLRELKSILEKVSNLAFLSIIARDIVLNSIEYGIDNTAYCSNGRVFYIDRTDKVDIDNIWTFPSTKVYIVDIKIIN